MSTTKRLEKGAPLTAQEFDANMQAIDANTVLVAENKVDIEALQVGQTGGLKSFTTLALLQAYATPNINDSYKVTNDTTTSNNGYYHWVSGTNYVKDASLANGVVESGNVDAVSGDAVYDNYILGANLSYTRASLSVSGADITLGVGYVYTVFADHIQKSVNHTSETVYTLGSGGSLVHNKTSNSIEVRTVSTVVQGDAILLKYDSVKGIIGGLLYAKYVESKTVIDPATVTQAINNHGLFSISRASILIKGANITLGSGNIQTTFK
ncbi:hypothetical protein, partial [Candidatus Venteria ishoeyi]